MQENGGGEAIDLNVSIALAIPLGLNSSISA
jgi:hypothetical protein